MSKKYIIEIEDNAFEQDCNPDMLFRAVGFKSLVFDQNGLDKLKEYDPFTDRKTEIEYERNEAYQRGLEEAWEAAMNICKCDNISWLYKNFGTEDTDSIIPQTTASEVIAKLKEYKERQSKIEVGDEVKNKQTSAVWIVTHKWTNNRGEKGVSGFNHECSAFSTTLDMVKKTGRHFPEIAQVLEKMREGQE